MATETVSAATILVVDDEPANLSLLAQILRKQGYQVRIARNGSQALALARGDPPDLILLDIIMPDMDGYAVCEALKTDPHTRESVVIFISALHEVFDKVQAFAVGGVDYITRPFQVEEVLARVTTHLSLRQMQQRLQVQNARLEREIAERKQTEEAYRNLVDYSLQGLMILQDECIVFANATIESIYGYTRAELQAMMPDEVITLIHPDDRRDVQQHMQNYLRNAVVTHRNEHRILRKDGQVRWIEVFSALVEFRGRAAFQLAIVDITDRKEAEALLHKLQQAVEQSPSSIVITHRDGSIEYVNRHFSHLTGYTLDEVRGHNPRLLKSGITPQHVYEDLWNTITTGKKWHGELCNRNKSGEIYWESVSISPIFNDSGIITHFVSVKEDITRRKRMEEALRESQILLQSIIDNVPAIINARDLNGHYILANRAAAEVLDMLPEQMIGHHFSEVIPAELVAQFQEADDHIKVTCEVVYEEIVRPAADGQGVQAHLAYSFPLYDAQGQLFGISTIATNITDRKRMEDELRALNTNLEQLVAERTADLSRSETRSQALLNAMPDAMFLFYHNGKLLGFKSNDPDIFSIPPEQIIDSNLYDIMPPDFCMLCRTHSDRALATGATQMFEYELQMPSGAREFEARLVVCETDQIVAVVRDITERKQAERVLQASETRYRTLVETSPNAVLMADLDCTISYCNQQTADLFGYASTSALVGRRCSDLIAPGLVSRGQLQHMLTSRDVRNQECTLNRSDSSDFVAEINSSLITNDQQEPVAIIIIVRDISEQKQLQAQIIASERVATGGRLAASVAHEINTPLQALENFLDLVQVAPESDRQRFLQSAQQEVHRVARIVEQLLDIYRPHTATSGPVAVDALIERLLLLLGKRIKEQKVTVERDLNTDVAPIWGRADEVTQVVLNIMVNALDAMPNGGTLGVRQWQSNNYIHIAISDTGDGVATDWQKRIFEPFVTSKAHGVGLGLAVSYQIVRHYGGEILVESNPVHGSTFTVILPHSSPEDN